MQVNMRASELEPGDVYLPEDADGQVYEDKPLRVVGKRKAKGLIVVTFDNDATLSFMPTEQVIIKMPDRVTVYDLPVQDGRIDYIVPDDLIVMNSDRAYGMPGDHIHGISDPAGLELTVFDGKDCAVCAAPVTQAQARRWAKEISAGGVIIAVASTKAAAAGRFEQGDPEWGVIVNGQWYGRKADYPGGHV